MLPLTLLPNRFLSARSGVLGPAALDTGRARSNVLNPSFALLLSLTANSFASIFIHGHPKASWAVGRSAGFIVNRPRTNSFASSLTASHASDENSYFPACILGKISFKFDPVNGVVPLNSRYVNAPTLHMSELTSYGVRLITSGATYNGEPHSLVNELGPVVRELNPKSANLARVSSPSVTSMTFLGLRSQWAMFRRWQCRTARRTERTMSRASNSAYPL
mmetsp:Transcript_44188/g.134545  ORF Transcript_44188/g.134545 Transcript_44188/m.134545 type:complete len:220 (-) Transcript_44188:803-1462(-)